MIGCAVGGKARLQGLPAIRDKALAIRDEALASRDEADGEDGGEDGNLIRGAGIFLGKGTSLRSKCRGWRC